MTRLRATVGFAWLASAAGWGCCYRAATRRVRTRARYMMMGERPPVQPRKAEAFAEASKDIKAPAVILVQPFLDENVGSVARAMLNFGLTNMRLVTPECDHTSHMARVRASGADEILERAQVYPDVASAVGDLTGVVATTARQRDMTIEVVTPETAARLVVEAAEGERWGIMFGPERSGLANKDLVFATKLLSIPTMPAFSSLNLGQACQIIGYEYWKARSKVEGEGGGRYHDTYQGIAKATRLASAEEIGGLWTRMQELLDQVELNPDPNHRSLLYDRFLNLLSRSRPDIRDVNSLHGVVSAIVCKHERLEGLRERILRASEGRGPSTSRRSRGSGVAEHVEEADRQQASQVEEDQQQGVS